MPNSRWWRRSAVVGGTLLLWATLTALFAGSEEESANAYRALLYLDLVEDGAAFETSWPTSTERCIPDFGIGLLPDKMPSASPQLVVRGPAQRDQAEVRDLGLHWTPTSRMTGRVLDRATSRPLRSFRASIWCYREAAREAHDSIATPFTNDRGEAWAIAPANLGFGTLAIDPVEESLALTAGASSRREDPYARFPATYVPLSQSRRSVESSDGSFELESPLAGGTYVVHIEAEGFAPVLSAPFQLDHGDSTNVGDLWIDHGGELTGFVHDRRGAPVAEATVRVFCAGLDPSRNPRNVTFGPLPPQPLQTCKTTTDKRGRYTLALLMATPLACIEVDKPGMGGADPTWVAIDATIRTEVPLITLNDGGRLSGTVFREGRAATQKTMVHLSTVYSSSNRHFVSRNVEANREGTFSFRGVPAGSYDVWASEASLGSGANPFQIVHLRRQTMKSIDIEEGRQHEIRLELAPSSALQPTGLATPD
jgi:hypothetical protein